ncbi:MAG: beta-L-arabinofuranosidase domain-containing protein [Bacteroidota bacterium]
MNNQEKLDYLMFGETKPDGWLLEQMDNNMKGFTGHLDELVPDLIVKDDIYGRNRLTKRDKRKDVGNIREGEAEWEVQYLWWNSETQSNWRDGYIRQAILTDNPENLQKVSDYLSSILSTQDSDGYLGIYNKNLRYHFTGENGELWAKATLLRGLLACYESGTGDRKTILEAIERAVQDVRVNYPVGKSDPFKIDKPSGGICHGLVFTDVLDRLHQLTGKQEYLEYAAFLYSNYSKNKLSEEDISLPNILNPKYKLKGHGVHTYEHLRALTTAFYATGDPELKRALDIYLRRIDSVTTPSGGPAGDEWISGRKADASSTGYEYCSIHELLDSYALLMQKTGKSMFGDQIERLFFNAAQGARHPEESSIAYLKSDNSYSMTGPLNDTVPVKNQTRFKYSPVHQDVAVCCIPNAGRIAPYYVRSMWMRDNEGLVATLYGPATLRTEVHGRSVTIVEETTYPYDFNIRFKLTLDRPGKFMIKLRKPSWIQGFTINAEYREKNNYIRIRKAWKTGDEIILRFSPGISVNQDVKNENYFTYGPLVLAHPIDGKSITVKEFPLPGFRDLHVKPVTCSKYRYDPAGKIRIKDQQGLVFEAVLINEKTGEPETVELVPMGRTILRQVTFKTK